MAIVLAVLRGLSRMWALDITRAYAARPRSRALKRASTIAIAVMFACCAIANDAHAAAELTLRWTDTAECPVERAELAQRIEAQLGRSLRDAPSPLNAEAHVQRAAHGFTLALRTERGRERGERTLQAESCGELIDALVLVLALSIDGAAEPSSPIDAAAAPAENQAGAAASENTTRNQDQLGREPIASLSYSLRASGLIERGALPRVAGGAELAFSFSWAKSHVELTGLWLPPVRSDYAADGARVDVKLWAARLGYCHDMLGRRLRVGGCGGFELGRVTGQGVELLGARQQAFPWAAGFLALRLSLRLSERFAAVLEPGLSVPIVRSRFVSSNASGGSEEVLHASAPVSGRVSLGVELSF